MSSEYGIAGDDNNLELPITESAATEPKRLANEIVTTSFDRWYNEYQITQNIKNGKPFFNGSSKPKPAGNFRASELLQCHRKIFYKHHKAPSETTLPQGQFFVGNKFEHELAEEFLEDAISAENRYIQNDLWAQVTINSELGSITINGSTDPVIVDKVGEPFLPAEIKTTSSIEYRSSPSEHHLAQLHSYMVGLSDKWNKNIDYGILLYADRDSLGTKAFKVPFDREFWQERVIPWLKSNTYYRVFGFLPPAEPEQDWECDYCPYQHRCGAGGTGFEDEKPGGFLPMFTDYPESKVKEYLDSHDDAKLTPSLANTHPTVAAQHDVHDWVCTDCDARIPWDQVEWEGGEGPPCPECDEEDNPGRLRDPTTDEQHYIEIIDRPEEDDE